MNLLEAFWLCNLWATALFGDALLRLESIAKLHVIVKL